MKLNANGNTELTRFNNTMSKLLSVSYDELQRRLTKASKKRRKAAKLSVSSRDLGGRA